MKASVDNTNLPILNEDGTISNYYIGRFKSALLSVGYELPQVKEAALNAFIEDGIQKGWIDYVDYMLPFIGNSDHQNAAFAPLIDRLGDYVIPVPDDTDAHITAALHFSGTDVTGFGSSTDAAYPTIITIPLDYTRYKGVSVLTRLNENNIGGNSYICAHSKNDAILLGIRRSPADSNLQMSKRDSVEDESSTNISQFNMASYGTFDLLISIYADKDDGSNRRNLYIKTVGTLEPSLNLYHRTYSNGPVDFSSLGDMDFKIKRSITGYPNCAFTGYLPYWMAINPYIPQNNISDLVKAVETLCTALGRDPE